MKNFEQIMHMLDWKNDKKTQQIGIEYAQEIDDISKFIQPEEYGNKSIWENCAIILSSKTDGELEPYVSKLLEWLQDINWPGAMTIAKRLKIYSGRELKVPLENAVSKANKMSNEQGLMWLDYLSELLDNNLLVSYLSCNTLTLLKKHYHNWANWYNE